MIGYQVNDQSELLAGVVKNYLRYPRRYKQAHNALYYT